MKVTINFRSKHLTLNRYIATIIMVAFLYVGVMAQTTSALTPNYIPKYTSTGGTTNSQLFDNGTNVGIGISLPSNFKLDVNGSIQCRGDVTLGGSNTWILHTPDDGRQSMFFGHKTTSGSWSWDTEFKESGDVSFSGNIGIGLLQGQATAPGFKLDVNGAVQCLDVAMGGSNSWFLHTPDDGRQSMFFGHKTTSGNWSWITEFNEYGDVSFSGNGLFSGKVRIGTFTNEPNLNGYLLAVNGKIGAKNEVVVVAINTPWPDYVFDASYKRMNFLDKEAFFKKYKHLPGIDSEKDIEQNGLKIVETLAGITQNLEENSLDIIEISKQNEALKAELEILKKELAALKNK